MAGKATRPRSEESPGTCIMSDEDAFAFMAKLEAEFIDDPERRQTKAGNKFGKSATSGPWHIKPVEGGPEGRRTKADHDRAMKRWENDVENKAFVEAQLMHHHMMDLAGNPLGSRSEQLHPQSEVYARMESLIAKYQFQSEADSEEEEWIRSHNPSWQPPANRFKAFQRHRVHILATASYGVPETPHSSPVKRARVRRQIIQESNDPGIADGGGFSGFEENEKPRSDVCRQKRKRAAIVDASLIEAPESKLLRSMHVEGQQ